MPSTCGALTSARRCRSVRTAARSIFSIASASGASAAAARRLRIDNSNAATSGPNVIERFMMSPRSAEPSSLDGARDDPKRAEGSRSEHHLQSEQLVDLPLTVGERVEPHADFLEQRQVQIGE